MEKDLLIHPGEILKEEFLVPLGVSANRLASTLGFPTNRITAIINGTRRVTGETAILLGHAFGTSPEFWLNLQMRHDLDLASHHGFARSDPQRRQVRPGHSGLASKTLITSGPFRRGEV